MARAKLVAAASGVIGLLAASSVVAADFDSPVRLASGARIQVRLEVDSAVTNGGKVTNNHTALSYGLVVASQRVGYQVTEGGSVFEAYGQLTPAGVAELQKATAQSTAFSYEAAADTMRPLRILDWEAYRKTAGKTVFSKEATITPGMVGKDATSAAAGLLAPNLVAVVQGLRLDLDKPLTAPIAFNGVLVDGSILPLSGTNSIALVSLDQAKGRAVIETSSVTETKTIARRRQGFATPPPVKFGMAMRCRYDMDLKSGLAVKADCTRTLNQTDRLWNPQTTVLHYLVTQTLVTGAP